MRMYLAWAALLIVQNFSFVIVSRSSSLLYHGIASIFSNGIWFASQFILMGNIAQAIQSANLTKCVLLVLFYTTFTLIGSLSSHWVAMKYLEKAK